MKKNIFGLLGMAVMALTFAPAAIALGVFALMLTVSLVMPSNAAYSTLPVNNMDVLHAEILRRADDRERPTTFLQSLFRRETVNTLNVSFRTKQRRQKVAVDVNIQTKGEMHKRQIGSLETVQPPLYWEFTTLSESDMYNGVVLNPNVTGNEVREFSRIISMDLEEMSDEFERAFELQCAQVFDNGILQFNSNDNINYGRLGGSMVTASTLWTATGANPYADISAGTAWIKTNALTGATEFMAVMGSSAIAAFMQTDKVLERQNYRRLELDSLYNGGKSPAGGNYWGTITDNGGNTVHIWSYDGMYQNTAGTMVPYIAPSKVIIIPRRNELTFVDAAVKMLPGTPNFGKYGRFYGYDFPDFNHQVHYYHLKGRGIAIPQEINEIYTLTVTA